MMYGYADRAKSNSVEMLRTFGAGMVACGEPWEIVADMKWRDGDAVFYGITSALLPLFNRHVSTGRNWWLIDNGYFKSKWKGGDHYRITMNRAQHDGIGESDGKRWAALVIEIKPWHDGDVVLIAQQSEWWYLRHGTSRAKWTRETVQEISPYLRGRLLDIRSKDSHDTPINWPNISCVVTHSSNVAVDGLLEGVPCFTTAQCAARSMAGLYPLIDNRVLFNDRRRWAQVLADNQFTLEEMRSGLAWRMLNALQQ